MTAIGKLLTFLTMILSLAWAGLTANAFVTRNNWKADADHYKAEAKRGHEAAAQMKAQLDAQREATTADKLALESENERLVKLLAGRETHLNGVVSAYSAFFKNHEDVASTVGVIQTNEKKLQQQVDDQTGQLSKLQLQLDDKIKEAAGQTIRANKNYQDAKAQELRADTLEGKLQATAEQLEELKRDRNRLAGGGGGLPGDKAVAVPPGFHGTVLARDVQGTDVLVVFSPGLDAGLQKGAVLKVYRSTPTPKYLGKVVVTLANPKNAVGRFIPPPLGPGAKLTADDYPKANDELDAE